MRKITIFLISLGIPYTCLPTASAMDQPAPVVKDLAVASKSEVLYLFFSRLKALADYGNLSDPSSVSTILGMDFQAEISEKQSACNTPSSAKYMKKTRVVPEPGNWYKPLPSGLPVMEVPAAFINPTTRTGSASFDYQIRKWINCNDRFDSRDNTHATLSFLDLPSFARIELLDIERWLPGVRFVPATDGVSLYRYQGKLDDDSSTTIEFLFRLGAPYALSASVSKDHSEGLRYLRTESIQGHCRMHVDPEFCPEQEQAALKDSSAISRQMAAYADQVCVMKGWFYRNDTRPGMQSKPSPPYAPMQHPCRKAQPK